MSLYLFCFTLYLKFGELICALRMHICQKAVADVERAIIEALCKRYADVLSPLKDYLSPKKFGLKYVQKIANRSVNVYFVPDEVNFCSSFACFIELLFKFPMEVMASSLFSARDSPKFHEKDFGCAVAENRKPV